MKEKQLKAIYQAIAIVAACCLVIFGAVAFANWSVNPGEWSQGSRGGVAGGCGFVFFMGLIVTLQTISE